MVLSASAYTSSVIYGSVWTIFERQAAWMGVGLLAFFGASRLDYVRGAVCGSCCRRSPSSSSPSCSARGGRERERVQPLDGFGQLRLQPSELMKFAIAVFGADLLARRAAQAHRTRAVVRAAPARPRARRRPAPRPARHGHRHRAVLHRLHPAVRRGRAVAPDRQGRRRRRRAGRDPRHRRAVPARPAAVVPQPLRPRQELGLPGGAVARRFGLGRRVRPRPRAPAGRSGASCPTPTPTSSFRSSARRGG